MNESKTGKKPDGAGGGGTEAPRHSEVEGHAKQIMYYCFNCGRANYIDPSWKYFTCWYCGPGTLNYIN
jgi:hypothetical protein